MANLPTSLSNEDTKTCTGLTPTAIPEVKKPNVAHDLKKRGVREECLITIQREYPEEPDKQWFVLRVTYNRAEKAHSYFRRHRIKSYLPMHKVKGRDAQGRKKKPEPLLQGLIFVYEKEEKVRELVKETPKLSYLRYYYNRFAVNPDGTEKKLILPYPEMINFIVITSIKNPSVKVVNSENCHFKSGDLVKVVRGEFKDVVGRIARVGSQTCVVAELRNVCLVATAYIPKEDLAEYHEG